MGGENIIYRRGWVLFITVLLLVLLIITPLAILLTGRDQNMARVEYEKSEFHERSIFYGKEPREVANIVGMALRNTTYKSSMMEGQCANCIHMDYDFGKDDHLNIRYSRFGEHEYYYEWLYFAKSDYKENEGDWDEEYAMNHAKDVIDGFLDPFNISEISDYSLNIMP